MRYFGLMAAGALAAISVCGGIGAWAQSAPKVIRVCTGASDGKYYEAGDRISQFVDSKNYALKVLETNGTQDNLDRLMADASDPNSCEAMIGQPDGAVWFKRTDPGRAAALRGVMPLHREYLHVLCNRHAGINDLSDFAGDKKHKLAIGAQGSGGWLIWENFKEQNSDYKVVTTTSDAGMDAVTAVASGDVDCMLRPAAAGDGTIVKADAQFGDTIDIYSAKSRYFDNALDIDGSPLYECGVKVPTEHYPITFGKEWKAKTCSWHAKLYVNKNKLKGKDLAAFIEAAGKARNGIINDFGN